MSHSVRGIGLFLTVCVNVCTLLACLSLIQADDHDAMSHGVVRSVQLFKSPAHAQAAQLQAAGLSRFHGLSSAASSVSSSLVVLVPDVTAGPYPEALTDYEDSSNLLAAAIAGASGVTSNRTSVLSAIPFSLTINVYNVSGTIATPIDGASVYIWHCDGIGVYSAVSLSSAPANHEDTTGQKWLRGYQTTSSDGAVTFNTIIPGWYTPRFVHFHVRVRLANAATNETWAVTTQLFPSQTIVNGITSLAPYSSDKQSLSTLTSDQVYSSIASSLASELVLDITGSTSGYSATFNLGIESATSSSSSSSSTATTTIAATTTTTTTTVAGTQKSSATAAQTIGMSALLGGSLLCAFNWLFFTYQK